MALDSLQWLRGELADLGQGLFLDLIICKTLNPPFVFLLQFLLLLIFSFLISFCCRQEFTRLSDSLAACPASKLGVLATITKRQPNTSLTHADHKKAIKYDMCHVWIPGRFLPPLVLGFSLSSSSTSPASSHSPSSSPPTSR